MTVAQFGVGKCEKQVFDFVTFSALVALSMGTMLCENDEAGENGPRPKEARRSQTALADHRLSIQVVLNLLGRPISLRRLAA
jgi:hypothetical protein